MCNKEEHIIKFEELSEAGRVLAWIPPFKIDMRGRVEEFNDTKFIDGEIVCIGKSYKITGKVSDFYDAIIMVYDQEGCETYKIRLLTKKKNHEG